MRGGRSLLEGLSLRNEERVSFGAGGQRSRSGLAGPCRLLQGIQYLVNNKREGVPGGFCTVALFNLSFIRITLDTG